MNKKILGLLLATSFVFIGCSKDNQTEEKKASTESLEENEKANTSEEKKTNEGLSDTKEKKSETPQTDVSLKAASYKFESFVGGAPYDLTEVRFITDGDNSYYDFKGNKDGEYKSLRVDANTAEESEIDGEKSEDAKGTVDLNTAIPPEEAMRIALEENGGGKVTGWSLKNDGENSIYQVEIDDKDQIKINALSKDVIK